MKKYQSIMKFLVITDLHQNTSAIEWINRIAEENEVKAILFLGDVLSGDPSNPGDLKDARDILSKINSEIYFIPGNCDFRNIPEGVSDIVNNVHGKSFEIDGIKFAAFGGSNPTIFDTPFETSEEDIERILDPLSKDITVLMTHAPSYGILDEIPSGLNVGSKGIRSILDRYRPEVALSGHIHEAIGIKDVNGTLCINPGPARDGHAVLLTIDGDNIFAQPIGPAD